MYCVEDIDNEWVVNHFKDVAINTRAALLEDSRRGQREQDFVAICAPGAGSLIDPSSWDLLSREPTAVVDGTAPKHRQDLNFIPYYARANRGGSGQMRVGLRIARDQ